MTKYHETSYLYTKTSVYDSKDERKKILKINKKNIFFEKSQFVKKSLAQVKKTFS